jgi:hypothetical protein
LFTVSQSVNLIDYQRGEKIQIHTLQEKSQKSIHVMMRSCHAKLDSINEDVLMGYFADLIIELLNEQSSLVSEPPYESSWNIEKILVCRLRNNSELVYLQLDCFHKDWRKELICQFHEGFYPNDSSFFAPGAIEIVELRVKGNLEECSY